MSTSIKVRARWAGGRHAEADGSIESMSTRWNDMEATVCIHTTAAKYRIAGWWIRSSRSTIVGTIVMPLNASCFQPMHDCFSVGTSLTFVDGKLQAVSSRCCAARVRRAPLASPIIFCTFVVSMYDSSPGIQAAHIRREAIRKEPDLCVNALFLSIVALTCMMLPTRRLPKP